MGRAIKNGVYILQIVFGGDHCKMVQNFPARYIPTWHPRRSSWLNLRLEIELFHVFDQPAGKYKIHFYYKKNYGRKVVSKTYFRVSTSWTSLLCRLLPQIFRVPTARSVLNKVRVLVAVRVPVIELKNMKFSVKKFFSRKIVFLKIEIVVKLRILVKNNMVVKNFPKK